MKLFSKFAFCLLCLGAMSIPTFAQTDGRSTAEEDVITESSQIEEDKYIDDVVKRTLTDSSRAISYEAVREADIVWSKRMWRIIETREKMNLVWRAQEAPFFNVLKGMIENGDITVFDDEAFKKPLSFEQVQERLNDRDTITTIDYETYTETIKVVDNVRDWSNINKYRIKEIWFFDKEASILRNRIIGIAPIYDEIITDTQVPGAEPIVLPTPLFWVYYPEARPFLAKHRVIGDGNDSAPMTWTDLLDNRHFSSYIYKRTNTLDYRVQDFFSTNDPRLDYHVLMESDKIKNELFNFEHDLWEY